MNASIQRLEELFIAAAEIPDGQQRQIFLEKQCAGDAALRGAVEQLMLLQKPAEDFFKTSGVRVE